jgi:hypothetical protein
MSMLRRLCPVLVLLAVSTGPAFGYQPPAPPEGFEQVTEVPPGEQLPAAPFVIGAYAFFLVLMVGYVWSVGRRLNKVEKEMATLQRMGSSRSGAP